MASLKFSTSSQSFHAELKKRISDYFKQAGKSSTGNFSLYFKAVILVVSFLFVYAHLVFYTPATWTSLLIFNTSPCNILPGPTSVNLDAPSAIID